MMKKCIDISAWQGEVSVATFQKMRKNGIPCVIIRSSYTTQKGFNLYADKYFQRNIINAYKGDMAIGIYHYSQAISETEAKKEAQFVLKTIKGYKSWIHLPVFFDTEFGGRLNSSVARKMGKQRYAQICDAFCNTIREAGYKTGVYANLSTLNGYIGDISRWYVWCAQYAKRCDYKKKLYMWQYTSSGRVDGIAGRVDMNYLYGADPEPTPKRPYTGTLPNLPKRGWFTSGDKGAEVLKLQKFLNWYFGYKKLAEDSEVGRLTMNAVREFQQVEGLKVDGGFGPECLKRARTVQR